jgi:hypothetical protein
MKLHILLLLALLTPTCLYPVYRDEIGWTRLAAELGNALPSGAGITVAQIESPFLGNHRPDPLDPALAGKTFTWHSPGTGSSSHATLVARNFYGHTWSMAPGITEIDVYEAVHWLGAGFLHPAGGGDPLVETVRVQNHSWTGNFNTDGGNIEHTRRLDFAIQRDGFVAVVALSNTTAPVPGLLAPAYNVITVGRHIGQHSSGGTQLDEPGRMKPDLVAPSTSLFTSYSTPVVSAAAALLLETAESDPALANARRQPEVIKTILMTGASKETFPEWSRSETAPIDPVFGAGMLNVYHSYHILMAGEQKAGSLVSHSGWDLAHTHSDEAGSRSYYFNFHESLETFTANLTWLREIADTPGVPFADREVFWANLDLRFMEVLGDGGFRELQASRSWADNVEHIFIPDLSSGHYALVIDIISDNFPDGVDYALAWNAVVIPETAGYPLLSGLAAAGALLVFRRRRALRNA